MIKIENLLFCMAYGELLFHLFPLRSTKVPALPWYYDFHYRSQLWKEKYVLFFNLFICLRVAGPRAQQGKRDNGFNKAFIPAVSCGGIEDVPKQTKVGVQQDTMNQNLIRQAGQSKCDIWKCLVRPIVATTTSGFCLPVPMFNLLPRCRENK